eukprot:290948_1
MNKIQIFIKPMVNMNDSNKNQTFVLTVSNTELIDDIRREIFGRCHIAPNRQILRFNNKLLQSGTRLNEYYGLCKDSTVYVLYNEQKDWFQKERQNIENEIIKLNHTIDSLKTEQSLIDDLTASLKTKIKTAPSLKELNLCKIEDCADVNMSQLSEMVLKFQHKMENGSMKQSIDLSMDSLNVLINNALTSVNHEEEMKCTQMDKKMSNIEYKIKLLEGEMRSLETQRATLVSRNDKHREDLTEINNRHIKTNKCKIKSILNHVNMNCIVQNLKESKIKRFKELEAKNEEFDCDNLILWIRSIQNRHFDHIKYKLFFANLEKQGMDGENLQELSSSICLSLLGLADDAD